LPINTANLRHVALDSDVLAMSHSCRSQPLRKLHDETTGPDMRILTSLLIAFAVVTSTPVPASAEPEQCWFYVHSKMNVTNTHRCLLMAEMAMRDQGFAQTKRNSTSDGQAAYVRAGTNTISADILCYEVNGRRGKMMAFITAAGPGSCPIARGLFNTMSNN